MKHDTSPGLLLYPSELVRGDLLVWQNNVWEIVRATQTENGVDLELVPPGESGSPPANRLSIPLGGRREWRVIGRFCGKG